ASDQPADAPADASDQPADAPADASLEPNATVERVVDGDTIIVDIGGQRERVRLIGIDTPESVDENRPVQCYGHEASAFVTDLLPPGTPVTLILDAETRDQYGRLLAYVVRSSDQLFVNLTLLELGYADTLTIEPNDHYARRFESAAAEARAEGRGLWGVCGGPDVPLG
ncbi:MAG: thermonuclease, partial [Actinomyces sp.]